MPFQTIQRYTAPNHPYSVKACPYEGSSVSRTKLPPYQLFKDAVRTSYALFFPNNLGADIHAPMTFYSGSSSFHSLYAVIYARISLYKPHLGIKKGIKHYNSA